MKRCTGICKEELALTAFGTRSASTDGLTSQCKACLRKKAREKYKKDPEKGRARARKRYKEDPEKKRARNRKRYRDDPEKYKASVRKSRQKPSSKKKRRERERKRYNDDPEYKTGCKLRSGTWRMHKGISKSASTKELLGCTLKQFNSHMEKQFQPGMTLKNQGKWQNDHIVPCASFDKTNPEHQRQCFHYTNYQPLWKRDNIRKSDKRVYNRVWDGTKWIYQYIPVTAATTCEC